MIASLLILGAAIYLYYKKWLTLTRTGILKPLIGLTIAGVNVSIKKPSETTETDAQ